MLEFLEAQAEGILGRQIYSLCAVNVAACCHLHIAAYHRLSVRLQLLVHQHYELLLRQNAVQIARRCGNRPADDVSEVER